MNETDGTKGVDGPLGQRIIIIGSDPASEDVANSIRIIRAAGETAGVGPLLFVEDPFAVAPKEVAVSELLRDHLGEPENASRNWKPEPPRSPWDRGTRGRSRREGLRDMMARLSPSPATQDPEKPKECPYNDCPTHGSKEPTP